MDEPLTPQETTDTPQTESTSLFARLVERIIDKADDIDVEKTLNDIDRAATLFERLEALTRRIR